MSRQYKGYTVPELTDAPDIEQAFESYVDGLPGGRWTLNGRRGTVTNINQGHYYDLGVWAPGGESYEPGALVDATFHMDMHTTNTAGTAVLKLEILANGVQKQMHQGHYNERDVAVALSISAKFPWTSGTLMVCRVTAQWPSWKMNEAAWSVSHIT